VDTDKEYYDTKRLVERREGKAEAYYNKAREWDKLQRFLLAGTVVSIAITMLSSDPAVHKASTVISLICIVITISVIVRSVYYMRLMHKEYKKCNQLMKTFHDKMIKALAQKDYNLAIASRTPKPPKATVSAVDSSPNDTTP